MFVITKEINSLNEYLDFIFEHYEEVKQELWYRGQRDHKWNLDTSLNREKKMDIPERSEGEVVSLKYKNIPDFLKELDMFINAMNGNVPLSFNKFHMMFLGQHYKLKTPALDWSTDPLVALYFALDGYVDDGYTYPLVFILKPNELNTNSWITDTNQNPICKALNVDKLSNDLFDSWFSDMNNTPFPIVPLAVRSELDISHRISRQSGVFTLMDTRQPLNYPWIQTEIDKTPFAITVKINPKAVESIRKHLEVLNVTKDTIYGRDHEDWDDLCDDIVKKVPKI